jgi:short-subunit dehydrogenase
MPQPSLALVTGATSGIGRALCHLLARHKINLLATGRNEKSLNQLREELKTLVQVDILVADLNKKTERARLIEKMVQSTPDLIINNAGFGLYGGALTYRTEEQESLLEVNGMAVLEMTLEAARLLILKEKKGTILNISSAAAFQIMPEFAVYCASKAFVNQFSEALDEEIKSKGVRVLVACPGMVDTSFQERAGGQLDSKDKIGFMTPDFVANQIWWQIQKQKKLHIIDWRYRLLTYLSYLLPKQFVTTLIKRNISKRIPPREIIKTGT